MQAGKKRGGLVKKLLGLLLVLALLGAGLAWYLFNMEHEDTATASVDYTVSARDLINEFKAGDPAANAKYGEKVVVVRGRISSMEAADTSFNVKMEDESGSYVIFAFQPGESAAVQKLKVGDSTAIKGICSGGAYSDILETEFITFKRSSLHKNQE